MDNTFRLSKTVSDKTQRERVIDRSFSSFVPESVDDGISLEEFFALYDELYYIIPIEGELNSHKYLIQRSSELADFEKDTTDIEPLLREITSLREQLLEARQRLLELEIQAATP